MSAKVIPRTATPVPPRPKTRDDTPNEARAKAEGWITDYFARKGLDIAVIGLTLVKAPIVRFVAQTRDAEPRSFTGTLDVMRGRVENVQAGADLG